MYVYVYVCMYTSPIKGIEVGYDALIPLCFCSCALLAFIPHPSISSSSSYLFLGGVPSRDLLDGDGDATFDDDDDEALEGEIRLF